jgi:hypothetical protein
MCRLSVSIRSKKDWNLKYKNPEILAKWRKEALSQAITINDQEGRMTENEVDYVLKELAGYEELIGANGVQVEILAVFSNSSSTKIECILAELF